MENYESLRPLILGKDKDIHIPIINPSMFSKCGLFILIFVQINELVFLFFIKRSILFFDVEICNPHNLLSMACKRLLWASHDN